MPADITAILIREIRTAADAERHGAEALSLVDSEAATTALGIAAGWDRLAALVAGGILNRSTAPVRNADAEFIRTHADAFGEALSVEF
jgi:hypothetical protein